jgi:DMSO/TMAO reductase YedYZ molybdopterin-dependent catalytic subunit
LIGVLAFGLLEPFGMSTHGLVSTSEWTGVPLSTLLKQVGLQPGAAWVLAEGADAAVMTRSVVLQALAKPIDRPGHGHVELPLRGAAAHRVEARALVPVLGATDTVIILDLDDIASHAGG